MATQFAIPAGAMKVNTSGAKAVPGQSAGVSSTQKGLCFGAGTLIHTPQGLRPIEDIQPGDLVLARDDSTGETAWQPVKRLFVTPDQPTMELTLGDDSGVEDIFQVTPEHPFWVNDKGWVGAYDLVPGDEVFSSSGGWVRVKGSTWTSQRQTVYNFEVENFHAYFVGKTGAWVHKSCQVAPPTNGTGAYRDVSGHHVHAKKAFEGATGYDFREAFSVSADMLKKYGVRHADITAAQQRLFNEFAVSGAPNTLTHHSRIAYKAMVEAGMPPSVAKDFVAQSQSQLIRQGIVEPTKIPWGGR